jgi:hypothetical protein
MAWRPPRCVQPTRTVLLPGGAPAARSESYVARWPVGLQAVLNWPALRRRACPGVAPRWSLPPRRQRPSHRHGAPLYARDWRRATQAFHDASRLFTTGVSIVSRCRSPNGWSGAGGSQDPDRWQRHHPGSARPLAWARSSCLASVAKAAWRSTPTTRSVTVGLAAAQGSRLNLSRMPRA